MSAVHEPDRGLLRSLYGHRFVRVAAAIPRVRVAEPGFNAERTLLARRASDAHASNGGLPPIWVCRRTRTRISSIRTR